jgi:hypothetical protein
MALEHLRLAFGEEEHDTLILWLKLQVLALVLLVFDGGVRRIFLGEKTGIFPSPPDHHKSHAFLCQAGSFYQLTRQFLDMQQECTGAVEILELAERYRDAARELWLSGGVGSVPSTRLQPNAVSHDD